VTENAICDIRLNNDAMLCCVAAALQACRSRGAMRSVVVCFAVLSVGECGGPDPVLIYLYREI
jgi:hypothetical protein